MERDKDKDKSKSKRTAAAKPKQPLNPYFRFIRDHKEGYV